MANWIGWPRASAVHSKHFFRRARADTPDVLVPTLLAMHAIRDRGIDCQFSHLTNSKAAQARAAPCSPVRRARWTDLPHSAGARMQGLLPFRIGDMPDALVRILLAARVIAGMA